ncbi:MAG: HlyD family efflux transporter periplasmic adaptor subunit [bacterium]|nr:HlyD family efflux transporter periplasmic adaptor subunit [bacterium]MCY3888323.1 HlyD family efflux transporter periplasmic adaptor subunit [bacterium]MCY4134184.1 HlyD family efflux transporter periplasmic adaptor subunit [bacterium]
MSSEDADASPGSSRPLFRERALEQSGRIEPIDGLLRVTAPHEWVILAAVAISLCALAAWLVFGTVERGVTAQCVVTQPGERHHAVATASGTVAEVLVRQGDRVEAGQPVARVTNGDLATWVALAAARLAALESSSSGGPEVVVARTELDILNEMQAAGSAVRSPKAGVVTAVGVPAGTQVPAGAELVTIRTDSVAELEVSTLLEADAAARVDPGMEARVSLVTPSSSTPVVSAARVEAFASGSAETPAVAVWAPTATQRIVMLSFDDATPTGTDDGDTCDVRIITSRHRPIGLLGGLGAS